MSIVDKELVQIVLQRRYVVTVPATVVGDNQQYLGSTTIFL